MERALKSDSRQSSGRRRRCLSGASLSVGRRLVGRSITTVFYKLSSPAIAAAASHMAVDCRSAPNDPDLFSNEEKYLRNVMSLLNIFLHMLAPWKTQRNV